MPHSGGDWEKAPPELAERFTAAVTAMPGAQVRKMFGYPAGFANGHLFTGLFASSWFVRLPDDQRGELAAAGGTPFEPMPGRPMREYLVLPSELAGDANAVEPWVARALAHAQQLPPKVKR
jgi:TfoX/Sxy family transcriptional regulator of competence genes